MNKTATLAAIVLATLASGPLESPPPAGMTVAANATAANSACTVAKVSASVVLTSNSNQRGCAYEAHHDSNPRQLHPLPHH
jgi:hypothetical protein